MKGRQRWCGVSRDLARQVVLLALMAPCLAGRLPGFRDAVAQNVPNAPQGARALIAVGAGHFEDSTMIPLDPLSRRYVGYKAGMNLWHDRQRLRLPCEGRAKACPTKYGAIANLYAVEGSDTWQNATDFSTERVVAIVELPEPGATNTNPPIDVGRNEVRLRFDASTATWTGRIVGTTTGSKTLMVKVLAFSESVPAAAQWDWDASAGHQLIGIRCGLKAWCELGTGSTVTPSPPPPCPASAPKTCFVKGWYDDQYLALPGSSSAGLPPRLSDIYGTIVPAEGILALRATDFVGGRTVAYMLVRKNYSKKSLTTGKTFTIYANTLHAITLRIATPIPADPLAWTFSADVSHPRIGSEATHQMLRVNRFHHTRGRPPGTARWQWRDDDEGEWVACAMGCCEILWD